MKCHPVTPMKEADLREHLKAQTELTVGLLDVLQLDSTECGRQFRTVNRQSEAVLIDVMMSRALSEPVV